MKNKTSEDKSGDLGLIGLGEERTEDRRRWHQEGSWMLIRKNREKSTSLDSNTTFVTDVEGWARLPEKMEAYFWEEQYFNIHAKGSWCSSVILV